MTLHNDPTIAWQPYNGNSWNAVQVKLAFNITLGKMLQPKPVSPNDQSVPYLKALNVQWNKIVIKKPTYMWASEHDIRQLDLKVGDLLVCEGGEVGRAASVESNLPENCIFQNALHRVRPAQIGNNRFLYYCLQQAANAGWFDVICNRATIAHFTVEKFKELRVFLPSVDEQKRLAGYLDRETSYIDSLIAEKEQMLVLLEEKRAALISQAVTRGLNPDVDFIFSGLDWLGEIPEDWKVLRLKFLVNNIDQGSSPQCYSFPAELGEWGVLKTGCVNGGSFRETENKALPNNIEPFAISEIKVDDVLMSRASGSIELIGSVACVESAPQSRLLLSDKIYRLNLKRKLIAPFFMVCLMGSKYIRHQIKSVISGAEGLANNIAKSDILEFKVAVPPLREQQEIIDHIKSEKASISEITGATRSSIELLKERRAALITAAVTGEIDPEEMTA